MKKPQSFRTPATQAILGVILAVGNVLLARYVGHWLVITGWSAVGLVVVTLLLGAMRKTRGRDIVFDGLLVLSLVNFNGWAFSHLSNLMVFIGLYFYALFGLILGSTMARLLSNWERVGRGWLVMVGMVTVLGAWWGGLVLESGYYPQDAYDRVISRHKLIPPDMTPESHKQAIIDTAQSFLVSNYGSAGVIGYLKWSVQSGRAELELPNRTKPFVYDRPHKRYIMWIRLSVSLVLLIFGVFAPIRRHDNVKSAVPDQPSSTDQPLPLAS